MEKIERGLFRITGYVADAAGCGNIRVIVPFTLLNQLQVKNFQFQAYFNNLFTKDVAYYNHSTIIQFQRAATDKHLAYFELIRRKIKILTRGALVYEIDDDLFNIPEWNFAFDYYKPYKSFIIEMLSKADGLVVSTQILKDLYSKFNNNISIIPNHLPRYTWGNVDFNRNDTKKPRIIYPCSSNHFSCKKDVKGGDISPVFLDYIRKTTNDYDWHFVGGMPLELGDLVKSGKISRHGWYSVYEYPRFLKSLQADIAIAPLDINDFNRSKSNIKCLEYSALGVPGVFTKIDPYDTMTLQAETAEEFISHLESLKDVDRRHQVWQNDYRTVADGLFWEDNDYINLKKYVKSYLNLIKKNVDFA
jgi:O-antigen biosynthesis protein